MKAHPLSLVQFEVCWGYERLYEVHLKIAHHRFGHLRLASGIPDKPSATKRAAEIRKHLAMNRIFLDALKRAVEAELAVDLKIQNLKAEDL